MDETKIKLQAMEGRLEKIDLALRRLILLSEMQSADKNTKTSKEYLNRLQAIAQDMIEFKKNEAQQELQSQAKNVELDKQKDDWSKTIKFVCPSKFLDNLGQLECEVCGKICSYENCPKKL